MSWMSARTVAGYPFHGEDGYAFPLSFLLLVESSLFCPIRNLLITDKGNQVIGSFCGAKYCYGRVA